MKNRVVWYYMISITAMVLFLVSLQNYCSNLARLNRLFLTEDTTDKLRAHKVSVEQMEQFWEWETESDYSCYEYLCAALITEEKKQETLTWYIRQMLEYEQEQFEELTGYLKAIWADLEYFPVPVSAVHRELTVSYVDSWMYERTFGGKRGHEGTDIMASMNERGRYPIISMTDGVVEQIGWLTQGGYRLGIRSPHGGYFYYAHLYDYAKDYQPGDTVQAGELIGFMGDSGYSEIEGTVGNFDVHLHLGIYVNQPDGTEMSINPFCPLQFLEDAKLKYNFY